METEKKALGRYQYFVALGSEVYTEDPKAAFRCSFYKPNKFQISWKDWLMKEKLSILITIKLPDYRSMKNYYSALNRYRDIIREIEQEFTNSKNHWVDKPLPFISSFQKTKSGTWEMYLLIKLDNLNENLIYKLCLSAQIVIEKHNFDDKVIDIKPIDKQGGISLFVLKTQTYGEDLSHDEGNSIFDLRTLFHVEEKPEKTKAFVQELGDKPSMIPNL